MSISGTYRLISAIENGSYTSATLATALGTNRTKSEFQAALNDRTLLTRLMSNYNCVETIYGHATNMGLVLAADPKILCSVLPNCPLFIDKVFSLGTYVQALSNVAGMNDALTRSKSAILTLAKPAYAGIKYIKQLFTLIPLDLAGPVLAMVDAGDNTLALTATGVMIRRKGELRFSTVTLPAYFAPNDIWYYSGTTVVAGLNSTATNQNIFYSQDNGETWVGVTNPGTSTINKVRTHGSTWVLCGAGGTILSTTDVTASWASTSRTSGTANALTDLHSDGTQIVAVGAAGTITRSTDGTTWSLRTSNIAGAIDAVTSNGTGTFVAVAAASASLNFTRSTDGGVTWTAGAAIATTQNLQSIVWFAAASAFVLGSATAGTADIAYSATGATWTNVKTNNTSFTTTRVACNAQTLVVQPALNSVSPCITQSSIPTVRPVNNADGLTIVTGDGSTARRAFVLASGVYYATPTTLFCNSLAKG